MIVTFYSYKGGVGRTMALANVAWILASNGKRVLAVDWDLESPGLHRYFHPFLRDQHLQSSPGVIDMIREYATAVLEAPAEPGLGWIHHYASVPRFAVSVEWSFPGGGYLDLLPAGKQDAAYTKAVNSFDWLNFFERLGGNSFLDALASSLRENYDFILIDSRTGVSDGAGICTVRLPDTVVNAFTLGVQSIEGAVAVARSIRRQRTARPVRLLPVPMRVEDAEQVKLEAGRDYARSSFAPLLTIGREDDDRYWGDVEIPYKPFYAYEEILAVFGERPRLEGSLLAAYERLTKVITDGEVPQLPAMDEKLRRQWLTAFERSLLPAAAQVLISYAAADRMWAEWIADQLADHAMAATIQEVDGPVDGLIDQALRAAGRVVVLFSQYYLQSTNATELWKLATERDPGGAGRFVVPIRLDGSALPEPFAARGSVDLGGQTEAAAVALLLDALDRPPQVRPPRAEPDRLRHRFPAAEPPIWNVLQRNVTFTGRVAALEQLRGRLTGAGGRAVPQALHGLGGVGKTQIALEYAHRFRADYDIVWWISAQQPDVVRAELAVLCERLDLRPVGGDGGDRVRATLDALRQGRPYRRWLLILDNADDPDELLDLLPQGPGHLIMTTRNQAWARSVDLIEVGVFPRTDSAVFLRSRVPQLTGNDASLVAERLGDLPLAMEQAAAYLGTMGMPVSTYLQRLDTQLPLMLTDEEELPKAYRRTGPQPWLLSLQSLRERSPAAAKLLEVSAFFAPEPIPMALIYGDRFIQVLRPYDPSLSDPMLVGRIIREIGRYALARQEASRPPADAGQRSLHVHRLVQAVIRSTLTAQAAAENRRHVHAILAARNPKDADDPANWPVYAELWPHLIPPGTLSSTDRDVRQLVLDVGRYLRQRSDYPGCLGLAGRAVATWTTATGPDDPQTLMMRFEWANALRQQAEYSEAYEIDRDVRARLERVLGGDHPYTLMVSSSLAGDLRALGRFREARDLDERTETRAREVLGDDDRLTLRAGHNLAISLRLAGDLHNALRMDQSVLVARTRVLGADHPETLGTAKDLGRDLRDTGQLTKSRQTLDTALEACRQTLGPDHPGTLQTAKSLAVTLRKLGEFSVAMALSVATLERLTEILGAYHTDTLACAMNLACDESAARRFAAAERRARPVQEWYARELGHDHPFTLAYTNNLAIFVRQHGDGRAAYDLTVGVVERSTALLGAEHPYTLAARVNLGNCLYALGRFPEGRAVDQQTFDRIVPVLGEEHPDTLAAAGNLLISRVATGDDAAGAELARGLAERCRQLLGPNHPHADAVLKGDRMSCDLEPPPT